MKDRAQSFSMKTGLQSMAWCVHLRVVAASVALPPPRPGRCTFFVPRLWGRSAELRCSSPRSASEERRRSPRAAPPDPPARRPRGEAERSRAKSGRRHRRFARRRFASVATRACTTASRRATPARWRRRVQRARSPTPRGSGITIRRDVTTAAGKRTRGAFDRSHRPARHSAPSADPPPVNSPGRTNTWRRGRVLPPSRLAR
jgi:hypothetical protein